MVRARLQVRMNCSPEITISFELGLGLKIEISVNGSDSSVNHPTRSKFKLGKGTGLNFLKVAMRRTSVRGWIDMCHDLDGLENDYHKYPLCSLFFGRGRELSLRRF